MGEPTGNEFPSIAKTTQAAEGMKAASEHYSAGVAASVAQGGHEPVDVTAAQAGQMLAHNDFMPTTPAGEAAKAHLTETPDNNFAAPQLSRDHAISYAPIGSADQIAETLVDEQQQMASLREEKKRADSPVESVEAARRLSEIYRSIRVLSEQIARTKVALGLAETQIADWQRENAELYDRDPKRYGGMRPGEFEDTAEQYGRNLDGVQIAKEAGATEEEIRGANASMDGRFGEASPIQYGDSSSGVEVEKPNPQADTRNSPVISRDPEFNDQHERPW